ncbi:MAG: hypothetical protein EDR02_09215 [Actinobacteria bacterium]|nr:MAG: hypothetical protein EDR02_09215 [Actinomycetota bacterium]RIK06567.1 MAG: hypothetical protein DCC48_06540 [Acidobacteriota bacterium]
MGDSVAGLALAAGAGTRLWPLTRLLPKPLCPVGGVPLIDQAVQRLHAAVGDVAVNVHHGRALIEGHLAGTAHLSVEEEMPLGTAGALGLLRPWLAGRAVLVVNSDTWCEADLGTFVTGWDGERTRILRLGDAALGPRSTIVASLMPWPVVAELPPEPAGLYERVWGPAYEAGLVELVRFHGAVIDCGTPARYLEANMRSSGGESVVPESAVVFGEVERTVLWPGAVVEKGETLRNAIRTHTAMTVLVR